MNQDIFLNYRLASQLISLGFNEPCLALVDTDDNYTTLGKFINPKTIQVANSTVSSNTENKILAPTYTQAILFLNEKFGINMSLKFTTDNPNRIGYKISIHTQCSNNVVIGIYEIEKVNSAFVIWAINSIYQEVDFFYNNEFLSKKNKSWFEVEIKNIISDYENESEEEKLKPSEYHFEFFGEKIQIMKNGTYNKPKNLFKSLHD